MKYEVFLERKAQKKLKGYKNHYRLRVGRYRVLFEFIDGYKMVVYAILPRRKAYR
ncbi:MAG: type II toxin-antitoxin system RelE/ParE family toxin [Methanosarcinales archaeon Met12]|nr:MAG: type II toxin-antitoxin system RelE/ParE family toxin [Methanosarcinales archaeon Met12]